MPTPAPATYMDHLKSLKTIPPSFYRDLVSALKKGASDSVAASAAGLSPKEFATLKRWTHGPWEGFARICRQARYEAVDKPLGRRHALASAEDASMHETGDYLKHVIPEDYNPPPPSAAPALAGAGGVQIIINKNFEPISAPAPSPALQDPDVIDAELVEDDE